MKKIRTIYFIVICCVILLGLSTRLIPIIPLFIGDLLWAVMIFFIIRLILINIDVRLVTVLSLIVCYTVEASQLIQTQWLNNIREILIGRLILGQVFIWTDIVAYTVGITICPFLQIGQNVISMSVILKISCLV